MCGRFTLTVDAKALSEQFGVELAEDGTERFNIAPTQEVASLVNDDDGGRRAQLLRWGLVPRWAKDLKVGYKMINARAETVASKPAYRGLIGKVHHRCLILADGFYEWLKPEDRRQPRQPLRFTLADQRPFAFAGLCTTWRSPEGEVIPSTTILTTLANELVSPVHDRMPVIFGEHEAEAAWLDPGLDAQGATRLLAAYPAADMQASRVSALVNSARNEGADLLDPGHQA